MELDKNIREEGIYRQTGAHSDIQDLKALFEVGESVDLTQARAHAVADLLKRFCMELPDPLLTGELYDDFMALGEIPSDCLRIFCLHQLIEVSSELSRLLKN
tara:strand:- start:181 stop:486 length:306 start_codon:yes stop_codon:yes gene_type:complete